MIKLAILPCCDSCIWFTPNRAIRVDRKSDKVDMAIYCQYEYCCTQVKEAVKNMPGERDLFREDYVNGNGKA